MIPKPPQVIAGKYQLVEQIGRGGFARVFRGVHLGMGRAVAVKVMAPRYDGIPASKQQEAFEEFARRFEKEAQLLSHLRHPATVTLFDYGHTEEGVAYMVLELVEGRPLNALNARELPLAPERVERILRQALESLREAHFHGILHRDIKPSNLMLYNHMGEPDWVKVLDFGMAKLTQRSGELNEMQTQQGVIVGTPRYMAPEQIDPDAEVGPQADLYALGLVCYELLTGARAYKGSETMALLAAQLDPRSMTLPSGLLMPRALREIIDRMMQKDCARRWPDALSILEALDEARDAPRRRADAHAEATRPSMQVDRRLLGLMSGEEVTQRSRSRSSPLFGEEGDEGPETLPGGEVAAEAATREMERVDVRLLARELRETSEALYEDLRETSEATRAPPREALMETEDLRETSEVDHAELREMLDASRREEAGQTLEMGVFELSEEEMTALAAPRQTPAPSPATSTPTPSPARAAAPPPKLSLSHALDGAATARTPGAMTLAAPAALLPLGSSTLPAPPLHTVARHVPAAQAAPLSVPLNPLTETAHTVAAPLGELDPDWDEAEVTNARLMFKPERVITLGAPKLAALPDAPPEPPPLAMTQSGQFGAMEPLLPEADATPSERLIVLNQRVAARPQVSTLTPAELTPAAPVTLRRDRRIEEIAISDEDLEAPPQRSLLFSMPFLVAAVVVVLLSLIAAYMWG